jgi:hypothetical protein
MMKLARNPAELLPSFGVCGRVRSALARCGDARLGARRGPGMHKWASSGDDGKRPAFLYRPAHTDGITYPCGTAGCE